MVNRNVENNVLRFVKYVFVKQHENFLAFAIKFIFSFCLTQIDLHIIKLQRTPQRYIKTVCVEAQDIHIRENYGFSKISVKY